MKIFLFKTFPMAYLPWEMSNWGQFDIEVNLWRVTKPEKQGFTNLLIITICDMTVSAEFHTIVGI